MGEVEVEDEVTVLVTILVMVEREEDFVVEVVCDAVTVT